MNRFMTAIAIVTTLSIVQGCTQLAQVKEEPTMTTTAHTSAAHAEKTNHTHPETQSASHAEHGDDHAIASTSTQVKLTTTGIITPNTPTTLRIDVQDQERKAIANFDTFQEQLMHLILVSDDLRFFNHLHPEYEGNGRFEVEARFPQSGDYTFFSDYQPSGQAEQVSVLNIDVPGNNFSEPDVNFDRTKTFNHTEVTLELSEATVKASDEVMLTFNLQDPTNNQPVTDLQPYLGEGGHLVILKQSSPLTKADYVHAHAMDGTIPSQVRFMARFPKPGLYKLWGQFNRNGKIITADFWVSVI